MFVILLSCHASTSRFVSSNFDRTGSGYEDKSGMKFIHSFRQTNSEMLHGDGRESITDLSNWMKKMSAKLLPSAAPTTTDSPPRRFSSTKSIDDERQYGWKSYPIAHLASISPNFSQPSDNEQLFGAGSGTAMHISVETCGVGLQFIPLHNMKNSTLDCKTSAICVYTSSATHNPRLPATTTTIFVMVWSDEMFIKTTQFV